MSDRQAFGEVPWDSESFGGGDKKNSKDTWLRLDAGPNEMRLLTQPFQYLVHKYKKENDPGFGQKVYCSMANGSCPLCATGDKPKQRWLLGVLSRKDGTYKILDVSYGVISGIRALVSNKKSWGDPSKYDVCIVVNKSAPPNGYYTVQPLPKEELSAADQLVRDNNVDLEDLKRRVTPPSPEQVQKRIDKIDGVAAPAPTPSATADQPTKKPVVKAKAPPPPVSMEDDDDSEEENFPNYEEK